MKSRNVATASMPMRMMEKSDVLISRGVYVGAFMAMLKLLLRYVPPPPPMSVPILTVPVVVKRYALPSVGILKDCWVLYACPAAMAWGVMVVVVFPSQWSLMKLIHG